MAVPAPGEHDPPVWNELDESTLGDRAVRHVHSEASARDRLDVGRVALPAGPFGRFGQVAVDDRWGSADPPLDGDRIVGLPGHRRHLVRGFGGFRDAARSVSIVAARSSSVAAHIVASAAANGRRRSRSAR